MQGKVLSLIGAERFLQGAKFMNKIYIVDQEYKAKYKVWFCDQAYKEKNAEIIKSCQLAKQEYQTDIKIMRKNFPA